MKIDPNLLQHPSDKAALQALKSIPGFQTLVKAYMSILNERQMRIINMSSNLRLSAEQMPEYYNMLPPICEKLGIPVPELYLEMNVTPNAYTYGDSNPFIVITSGLLEMIPDHLIPTVLAHECGHIACRHTLYSTMGRMILNGIDLFVSGLTSLLTASLQTAFAYWMRCSEFSADRAAVLCDGTPDRMAEVCFHFAGCGKANHATTSMNAFLQQAKTYKAMVTDSKWNKTLEFFLLKDQSHPLNAVRALECYEWAASQQYQRLNSLASYSLTEGSTVEAPAPESSKGCVRRMKDELQATFESAGFHNLEFVRVIETNVSAQSGQVLSALIDGSTPFEKGAWLPLNARIVVTYYERGTMEELAAAHPNQIFAAKGASQYIGRNYRMVLAELQALGFSDITLKTETYKRNWLVKEENVTKITIDGSEHFRPGTWFPAQAPIEITYSVFENDPTQPNPAERDIGGAVMDTVDAVSNYVGKLFRSNGGKN